MINTEVYLSSDTDPLLIRLLFKHPDVELTRLIRPADSEQADKVLARLEGEISNVEVVDADGVAFENTDLYIGEPIEAFRQYYDSRDNVKMIGRGGDILGVCELNRKDMVRGGRSATTPAAATMLCTLGLMPLARNLMLNSSVNATLMIPAADCGTEIFRLENPPQIDTEIQYVCDEVLPAIQTSFSSPIEARVIQSGASSFACGIFTIGAKIDVDFAAKIFHECYDDHRHIFFPRGPITDALVMDTNKTAISFDNDSARNLVVTVAFDARYKAGAGNIIHILNLLFGLDERIGL